MLQQVQVHPWGSTVWPWGKEMKSSGERKMRSQSERQSVPGWKLSLCHHFHYHYYSVVIYRLITLLYVFLYPPALPCKLCAAYKHTCKGCSIALFHIWSQSLCSSDQVVEPQYRVLAHIPTQINQERGSSVNHDVVSYFSNTDEIIKNKLFIKKNEHEDTSVW